MSVRRQLDRRRSTPVVLTLDDPAPLNGVPSEWRHQGGDSAGDQWRHQERDLDGDEPELSRSVRSKSLASVTTDVDQLIEQDEDDR